MVVATEWTVVRLLFDFVRWARTRGEELAESWRMASGRQRGSLFSEFFEFSEEGGEGDSWKLTGQKERTRWIHFLAQGSD